MIIRCAAVLSVGVVICAFTAKYILQALYVPYLNAGGDMKSLVTRDVIDPFSIHMEVSIFGGVILSLPFMLYFVGQFVLPALTAREKRFLAPAFAVGAALFVIGVAFCYAFVLRAALKFFIDYSTEYFGFSTMWTPKALIDFEVQMLVGFGLSFEFPLVILILNIMGVVSSRQLAAKRRHAAFFIFVGACCIVPSFDPFSFSVFCVPLYVLYEACIWISLFLERRRKKSEKLVLR